MGVGGPDIDLRIEPARGIQARGADGDDVRDHIGLNLNHLTGSVRARSGQGEGLAKVVVLEGTRHAVDFC